MKKLIMPCALVLAVHIAQAQAPAPAPGELMARAGMTAAKEVAAPVNDDIVHSILQSIPSPLELSVLIKNTKGADYNTKDLNDPKADSRYNTNFKKALNLGIYSADLGYANIYGKTTDALSYLNSVRVLADGLSIGQFFDYNTLKTLAESRDSLPELIQNTTVNFDKINNKLREQKRENLSILMLTGGWLEISHLTCLVYNRTKAKDLRDKIAEQKITLDQLLFVLDIYQSKPEFPDLINDLKELKKNFDKVQIETIRGTSKTVVKGGVLVVEDDDQQKITVSDEDLKAIVDQIASIRSKAIK